MHSAGRALPTALLCWRAPGAAGARGCLHSLPLNAPSINQLIRGGKKSPLAGTRQSDY